MDAKFKNSIFMQTQGTKRYPARYPISSRLSNAWSVRKKQKAIRHQYSLTKIFATKSFNQLNPQPKDYYFQYASQYAHSVCFICNTNLPKQRLNVISLMLSYKQVSLTDEMLRVSHLFRRGGCWFLVLLLYQRRRTNAKSRLAWMSIFVDILFVLSNQPMSWREFLAGLRFEVTEYRIKLHSTESQYYSPSAQVYPTTLRTTADSK